MIKTKKGKERDMQGNALDFVCRERYAKVLLTMTFFLFPHSPHPCISSWPPPHRKFGHNSCAPFSTIRGPHQANFSRLHCQTTRVEHQLLTPCLVSVVRSSTSSPHRRGTTAPHPVTFRSYKSHEHDPAVHAHLAHSILWVSSTPVGQPQVFAQAPAQAPVAQAPVAQAPVQAPVPVAAQAPVPVAAPARPPPPVSFLSSSSRLM